MLFITLNFYNFLKKKNFFQSIYAITWMLKVRFKNNNLIKFPFKIRDESNAFGYLSNFS